MKAFDLKKNEVIQVLWLLKLLTLLNAMFRLRKNCYFVCFQLSKLFRRISYSKRILSLVLMRIERIYRNSCLNVIFGIEVQLEALVIFNIFIISILLLTRNIKKTKNGTIDAKKEQRKYSSSLKHIFRHQID